MPGSQAVVTKLDTTVAFLDKHGLWEDMERPNDISYYEVVAPAVTRLFACAPTPPARFTPPANHPNPKPNPTRTRWARARSRESTRRRARGTATASRASTSPSARR